MTETCFKWLKRKYPIVLNKIESHNPVDCRDFELSDSDCDYLYVDVNALILTRGVTQYTDYHPEHDAYIFSTFVIVLTSWFHLLTLDVSCI